MLSWSTSGIGRENANQKGRAKISARAGPRYQAGLHRAGFEPFGGVVASILNAILPADSTAKCILIHLGEGKRNARFKREANPPQTAQIRRDGVRWFMGIVGAPRSSPYRPLPGAVFEYRCLQIRQDEQKITPGFRLVGDKVDHLGTSITPCERQFDADNFAC
jgi:hypothetical protein